MRTPRVGPIAAARPPRLLLALLAGTTAPALAQPGVRDSAGIRIVESTAPRWTAATRWRVDPTPRLAIGTVAGDSGYQLDQVVGVARLSDGRIVVLNDGTREVRLYDRSGKLLGSIGRQGDGPGEFRQFAGIELGRGDSLVVIEHHRIQIFSPDGRFVRVAARAGPDLQYGFPSVLLDDGSFLALRPIRGLARPAGEWIDSSTVDWIAADGARATELARVPREARYATSMSPVGWPKTYQLVPRLVGSADRFYLGQGDRYQIRIYSRVGSGAGAEWKAARLAGMIRRAVKRVPVTEAIREDYRRQTLAAPGSNGRPRPPAVAAQVKRVLDEMRFADFLPPFSRIALDRAGNLWVRGYDSREETPIGAAPVRTPSWPVSWDVFDPGGGWLGAVSMPARFEPLEFGADYLLGLSRDEDGVEQVRMLRLIKP